MPNSQANLAWEVVLELDAAGGGALHERLKRALRAAIREGRLTVGAAVPPSRALATDLGCSRWTVVEAYSQLVAEGYLQARAGSATRVRWAGAGFHAERPPRDRPAPPVPVRWDMTPGLPDLRFLPRSKWAEAVRSQAATVAFTELGHPDPAGHPRLRAVVGGYLERSRSAALADADLLITTGTTSAVQRLCRALVRAGQTSLAVEDPAWAQLHLVAREAGLQLVPIPVDEHGVKVTALNQLSGVRAVLVTPAHQYPNGVVLVPERRAQLLDWADRVDGLILEDDYDAEFRYDRPPMATLQGMRPSRVALLGSLSKTLAPSFRLGWMLVPGSWRGILAAAGSALSVPPVLDQLAFAEFLHSGAYDRHLRASRRRYRARRDFLIHALQAEVSSCRVSGAAAGVHLLLHLPAGVAAGAVVDQAAVRGLRLEAREPGATEAGQPGALIIGYGNLADSEIGPAVSALSAAITAAAAAAPRARPGTPPRR